MEHVVPLVPQPIAPVAPLTEGPVFEYHKLRRQRVAGWKLAWRVTLLVLLVVIGLGGWFGYKAFTAARNIISKSHGGAPALSGVLDPTRLKGEGDGRINILVLGIGGQGHEAPTLSDTIIVMSIDPKTKDAAMLSIPRDLYVKIPSARNNKINAANAYGGPELAEKVVSNIIGVPIHYYVQVDFSGFRQAVDAVGGIDVNVPATIYDPKYPCDNERGGYCAFSLKAGNQHMNGTIALRYARSRKGSASGDYDRAARQQLIIGALKRKTMEISTLTNPIKLSGLFDSVGGHVKTDMQPNEITKLAKIAADVDISKIVQKVLDTSDGDSFLVDATGRAGFEAAGSIAVPRRGSFDYTDIQDFVKDIFVDHYITDDNARVEVQNGSGLAGVAAQVVKSLKAAHYNVLEPLTAPHLYAKTVIYDYTRGKKPYTINYLERRFGVKATRVPSPAPTIDATGKAVVSPEIRIILGSDHKPGPTPVTGSSQ